jgi:hypothetical protein
MTEETTPRARIFQYAVIYHPAKKGEKSVLVVEPRTILATDENVAALKAARSIPEDYADKLDRVEVAVRPF